MKLIPLALGLLTLAIGWGPMSGSARHTFYGHMTLHMSVVAIAAPLLAFAVAGGPWDPVRRAPSVFSALLASLLELGVVWLWHTPALHSAARENAMAFAAEQGAFFVCGAFLWMSVFGGQPESRRSRAAAGVAALLLTVMHMTLLGALLALSPRPLYEHLHGDIGLSALADQQLGGAIMLTVGAVSYLAGGLWLSFELLREPQKLHDTQ